MKDDRSRILSVKYGDRKVGTLALTPDHKAAFAYDEAWIENGFSISPFSLPLKKQVFIPAKDHFDGLFGVFADSLPDAWGQLLLNRMLRKYGKDPGEMSVLDRLAIVGSSGMGALTFEPEKYFPAEAGRDRLDELALECRKILNTEYSDKLDELYHLGGTSGGARPKILTEIDGESWIIKFPSYTDGRDAGKMEYDYACCAKACGIDMSEYRLFPSDICRGYFGTKRFDRSRRETGAKKIHMLTAAALLELDFKEPSLDYHSLMKLTKILTRDRKEDVENLYRRMCFNVFAHNRDDHSKNFAYLYQESARSWRLSPAYDLTFSNTYYGEHTTTVDGNGKDPGLSELIAVGTGAGMSRQTCRRIAEEIRECVYEKLGEYL